MVYADNFVLNILVAIGMSQGLQVPDADNEVDLDEYDSFGLRVHLRWFEQPLDHFGALDSRTFLQRYIEDDTHFRRGGPLLVEIGGESEISWTTTRLGQSYELARQLSGKVVVLEHRYYGRSSPFENLTAETLAYLSVEQALEDVANFVDTLKKTRTELRNSKVAVFGCSYSGSLATWFRYKYPHLVDAAWASSAPLRAVADFHEYLEVATEVYSNVSWNCYNVIKEGYANVKRLLSTRHGSQRIKTKLENWSCGNASEMTTNAILTNIRYVIADHNVPPDHGSASCDILESPDRSAADALLNFVKVKSPAVCADDESAYPNNEIAWNYQVCTEFGFSITTTSPRQPFDDVASVIDDDMEMCKEFGERFTLDLLKKGIDRINRNYGAQRIKATKVLSVHGAYDPWHKLGLHVEGDDDAPVMLVPGVSHCADQLRTVNEPAQLVRAKKNARRMLAKWLS